MSLESPQGRQQQWQTHRAFLEHVRELSPELLPLYAKNMHDMEFGRVLLSTQNMSLESPQGRQQLWQIDRAFLAHVRELSPELQLEHAKNMHDMEFSRIVLSTQNKTFEQQWQVHRELLAHIGDVSPALLLQYARDVHNTECDRILYFTQNMSLESPQNRQQLWQIQKAFAEYTGGAAPQHLPEYARKICDTTKDCILRHTKNKPLEEQWTTNQEFLAHIGDVFPGYLMKYTTDVHRTEKDIILYDTQNRHNIQNKTFEEQWQIHHTFLTHIKGVAPQLLPEFVHDMYTSERSRIQRGLIIVRNSVTGVEFTTLATSFSEERRIDNAFLVHIARDLTQLLPELSSQFLLTQIREICALERSSVRDFMQGKPEGERWQQYQEFLVHIRLVAPQNLQENFQEIVNAESANIGLITQSHEQRQHMLNVLEGYVAQTHQVLAA